MTVRCCLSADRDILYRMIVTPSPPPPVLTSVSPCLVDILHPVLPTFSSSRFHRLTFSPTISPTLSILSLSLPCLYYLPPSPSLSPSYHNRCPVLRDCLSALYNIMYVGSEAQGLQPVCWRGNTTSCKIISSEYLRVGKVRRRASETQPSARYRLPDIAVPSSSIPRARAVAPVLAILDSCTRFCNCVCLSDLHVICSVLALFFRARASICVTEAVFS